MRVPEWITIKQAAELCGVSIPTIRNWKKRGILEWKQIIPGRRSPIYIRKLDLPTYARIARLQIIK